MKNIFIRFGIFTLALIFGVLIFKYFTFSTSTEKENEYYQSYVNQHYKVFAIELPDSLNFMGEPIPLSMVDIRERLDREMLVNVYWQSQTLLFIKRANKYFPVIEPILKKNGVPDDFKYLALAESGLVNVVSPAGATGYWQFLKKTGQEFNLEVNNEVDERYNLEKATVAFCDYINAAYAHFGSWSLAAASYNMGITGLQNQIDKQKVNNYFDLLLNVETGRYVFRIIAIKEILSNANKYGFYYRQQDLYPVDKFTIIEVDSAVSNFAVFAQEQGINYKILKRMNPWLRQSYLRNNARKTYQIKIPTEGYYSISNVESPQ